MQVKNPWCHMRWKGDFSPGDERNWTPELKAAVQYDREAAQEVDNGIFWLSWEVVLAFYSSIHCSWSPARFGVRRSVHGYWIKVTVASKLLDFPHNSVLCTRNIAPQSTAHFNPWPGHADSLTSAETAWLATQDTLGPRAL